MKSFHKLLAAFCLLAMIAGGRPTAYAEMINNNTNPSFTVKYKANIDTLSTSDTGNKAFSIIDTSGGKLPSNSDPLAGNSPKTIYLDNAGHIAKTTTTVEIYKSVEYSYIESPGVNYIDCVSDSGNDYILSSITILNNSQTIATITTNPDRLAFSNDPSDIDGTDGVIGIGQGYTVELTYDRNASSTTDITGVKFFDYDITKNGADQNNYVGYTVGQGVNSNIPADSNPGLYFGNRNIYTKDDSEFKKYYADKVDDWYINIANTLDLNGNTILGESNIKQGSFGISADTLTAEGKLQYNNNIHAPLLFGAELSTGSGSAGIHQVPGDHKLTFTRVGTEYRLSSSTVHVSNSNNPYVHADLDTIRNIGGAYSNNFFPLDGLNPEDYGAHDPKFGDPDTLYYSQKPNGDKVNSLPLGDDKQAHNCYLGMTFDIKFTLPENYIGPLDYLFFGDDDIWIYLVPLDQNGDGIFSESQKICDIGGVHSAIGEFVNLWDYIEGGQDNHSTQAYMLRFFYLERGASGSSCYMEFTLPQVWPVQPRMTRGGVQFEKEVTNDHFNLYSEEEFSFTVELGGEAHNYENYSYLVYDRDVLTDGTPSLVYSKSGVFKGDEKPVINLTHRQYAVIDNLPIDTTYTITETQDSRFTTTPGLCTTGTIGQSVDSNGNITGDTTSHTFHNAFRNGTLNITKMVDSANESDKNKGFSFTVTLKNGETPVSGTFGNVTFDSDGRTTFTLTNGSTKTISGIPAGYTYSVAEAKDNDFNVTWINQSGTIGDGTEITATATNTAKGTLEVKKVLTSEVTADSAKEFSFTVELKNNGIPVIGTFGDVTFDDYGRTAFTLTGGSTKTISGIPAGCTYSVTEVEDNDFNVVWSNPTGTIGAGSTATATATNTRKTGSLTITKTVVSDIDSDLSNKVFTFNVTLEDDGTPVNDTFNNITFTNGVTTFILQHGQTMILTGIPTGYTYLVEETDGNGFTVDSAGASGMITEYVDQNSSIPVAAFTNKKGGLKVSKGIEGQGADPNKSFTFTVTLSDTTITGTYGNMAFDNGAATFDLKGGEFKEASGLPADISYTVREADYSDEGHGYYTTVNGSTALSAEGNIPAGPEHAVAAFTNRRDAGNLTVKKVVSGQWIDGPTDEAQRIDFTFKVKLTGTGTYNTTDGAEHPVMIAGESINGTYGDMTFTDGTAEFTLKHGESKAAVNLPVGITYTVTETDTRFTESMFINRTGEDDRIVTQSGSDLIAQNSIPENKMDTVTFTNLRNTGDLIVQKIVTGADGETDRNFEFKVELDEALNGTYDEMTFKDGIAAFTLKDGESKTAAGLPSNMNYTVTEIYPKPAKGDEDGYTVTVEGNTSNRPSSVMLLDLDEEIPEEPKDVFFSGMLTDDQIETIIFTNENPGPVEVPLFAKKLLDGKEPGKIAFSFVLKDEEGDVLQTKNNDPLGAIVFDALTFEKPGTYTYTIEEQVTSILDIIFDKSVYTVIIDVVRDDQFDTNGGYYSAYVTYLKDGLPYEPEDPNAPEEELPTDPMLLAEDDAGSDPDAPVDIPYYAPVFANLTIPPLPPTGDNSHAALWTGLLILSCVGLGTLLLNKRRQKS